MKLGLPLLAMGLVAAAPAQAASFVEQNGFATTPSTGAGFSSCKSVSNVSSFTSGAKLGAANVSGFCVGYFGVTLDTTLKTLTFDVLQGGNYNYGFFEVTGITEDVITGLSLVTLGDLFSDAPLAPQLSFTSSSLKIVFQDPNQFRYNDSGGQAVFSYTSLGSVSAVPEPATWAMMLAGFGAMGVALRRRKQPQVSFAF